MIQAAKDREMRLEFGQDSGVFMVRFIKVWKKVVPRPEDVQISARQEEALRYLLNTERLRGGNTGACSRSAYASHRGI